MSVEQLAAILSAAPAGPDFSDPPLTARAAFDGMLASLPSPEQASLQEERIGGVPVLRASLPQSRSGVLLYLHGGAYIAGSARGMLGIAAGLVSADYRLGPEHPYPAAVEDALAVYRGLLAEIPAEEIVLAGDSAGGGLAAALLLAIARDGLPQPAGAVLLSPWADLACDSPSMTERAAADPLLDQAGLRRAAAAYLGGASAAEPLASPVHGDFAGTAPVSIHVGTEEVLHDDAVRLAETIRRTGGTAELRAWDGMVHDWSLFWFAGLDEADELFETAGDFARRQLDAQADAETVPAGAPEIVPAGASKTERSEK